MSKKITQLESATDVTASDFIQIVDIEDSDMAASGTNKKATAQLLANELGKLTNVTATGSTAARSLTNRFADVVNVKDFGVVGDGVTDDTVALNIAFAAANGKTLLLGPNETYRYNTSAGIIISSAINIVSNGSKFRELTANTEYKFSIASDNVKIDRLVVEFVGASSARFLERGISIVGSNIQIGEIVISADNSQTGANSGSYNAIKIGSDSGALKSNINIGSIKTVNWDRPIVLQNITQWQIGRIECITYRRGIYIKDCSHGEILGGHCRGASPTNTGRTGENGILVESVASDFATNNIRINNFHVEDAGEHGFRIGGQKIIENIWHIGCSAENTGLGNGSAPPPDDDDHGGCGFKVLGPTSVVGARHQGIHYLNCSVKQVVLDNPSFAWNFAGFQIGKVDNGSLVDCSVRPFTPNNSYADPTVYSCENGIEIIGCENLTITNPNIFFPRNSGLYFYDFEQVGVDWGVMENIKVIGGAIRKPVVSSVDANANYSTLRRIVITGLLSDGGQYALKASKTGSGNFIGCTFNGEVWNQTISLLDGASDWMVGLQGQIAGTLTGNNCRNGSWFSDWGNGVFRIRETYSWASAPTSFQVTLNDDVAISFAPRRSDGHVLVSMQGSEYYGHAWMRTSTAASVKVSGGSSFAVTNAALTGTTGTDGNVTLGAQPGLLYLENRSGNSQTISITQLG